jgi:hypothetical protein
MSNWFIRAITKDGKKFIKDYCQTEAIIIFKDLYEAAKNKILPNHKSIPHTWRTEIFKEFVDPKGVIVVFELCEKIMDGKDVCIFNAMWFEVDAEGRSQLKTQHHVSLEYTFYGLTRAPGRPGEFIPDLIQHEMSGDWHIGYYEPRVKKTYNQMLMEREVKKHEMAHTQVLKKREVIDIKLSDLPTSIPKEEIALTFEKATGVHLAPKAKPSIIVEGSTHNHDDWYSEPAMDQTKYRIYIHGRPSTTIVDDISFMDRIHKNSKKGIFDLRALSDSLSMPASLFKTLERFLRHKDFNIGAHPADQALESGHDAAHNLFWGVNRKELIYIVK